MSVCIAVTKQKYWGPGLTKDHYKSKLKICSLSDAHLPGSAVLGRPLDKLLCQTRSVLRLEIWYLQLNATKKLWICLTIFCFQFSLKFSRLDDSFCITQANKDLSEEKETKVQEKQKGGKQDLRKSVRQKAVPEGMICSLALLPTETLYHLFSFLQVDADHNLICNLKFSNCKICSFLNFACSPAHWSASCCTDLLKIQRGGNVEAIFLTFSPAYQYDQQFNHVSFMPPPLFPGLRVPPSLSRLRHSRLGTEERSWSEEDAL